MDPISLDPTPINLDPQPVTFGPARPSRAVRRADWRRKPRAVRLSVKRAKAADRAR